MLAAWRERPRVMHVAREAGVAYRTARRAIDIGWRDMGLLPLREIAPADAVDNQALGGGGVTANGITEDPTEMALSSAIALANMARRFAAQLMERMDTGEAVFLGEVTPQVVGQVARALATSNQLLEQAVRLAESRKTDDRSLFWTQLGALIDACTDEEMEELVRGGALPERLIQQHPSVDRRLFREMEQPLFEPVPEDSDEDTAAEAP